LVATRPVEVWLSSCRMAAKEKRDSISIARAIRTVTAVTPRMIALESHIESHIGPAGYIL
jgi:hypothetical protein